MFNSQLSSDEKWELNIDRIPYFLEFNTLLKQAADETGDGRFHTKNSRSQANRQEADFLKRAAFHVEALNHAVRNIPADRMRIHICWGNYEGPHDHDIAFLKVAPILVKAKPQALVVEAANPRHAHEWAVWQETRLPDDKILVPGVLDTSTNYVEHPELVAERICRFADVVGRERVIAGSDCGFGTFAGYGKLDPDISFKKLHAMAEGAAIASRRLWGRAQPG